MRRRHGVAVVPDEPFTFLGYTFGRNYSPKTGQELHRAPAIAEEDREDLRPEISEQTGRAWTWLDPEEMVGRLNRKSGGVGELLLSGSGRGGLSARDGGTAAIGSVSGWAGSTGCRVRDGHAIRTATCMRNWDWCGFQSFRGPASCGRRHETLSESRMREIRPSGSMSGRWKRGMVRLLGHRQPKGPATARLP